MTETGFQMHITDEPEGRQLSLLGEDAPTELLIDGIVIPTEDAIRTLVRVHHGVDPHTGLTVLPHPACIVEDDATSHVPSTELVHVPRTSPQSTSPRLSIVRRFTN